LNIEEDIWNFKAVTIGKCSMIDVDAFVKSRKPRFSIIPAKAGIRAPGKNKGFWTSVTLSRQ
jgi:hypothetical protein